jgi:hypothetical protein
MAPGLGGIRSTTAPLPGTASVAQDKNAARDWAKCPAIVEVDTSHDIYAVGDVHGDYERLLTVLMAAVLVCTGDLIDRWDQSLRVLALFRSLRVERLAAVAACRDPGQRLVLCPRRQHTHNRTRAQLRDDLQAGMDTQSFKAPVLLDADSLLMARMSPHPWWEMPGDTAAQSKEKLEKCVHALGVKHLVVGHQPGKITFAGGTTRPAGELFQHFDGLIFLIDTGMSRGLAFSTGAVLHIRQDAHKAQAFRILATGKSQRIW